MDGPYESGTTITALRLVDSALKKGHKVNVFAFEGAVSLTMSDQQPHADPVKGTTVEQQNHPTTSGLAEGLFKIAEGRLDWIN